MHAYFREENSHRKKYSFLKGNCLRVNAQGTTEIANDEVLCRRKNAHVAAAAAAS